MTLLLPTAIVGVVTSMRTRTADRDVPENPGRNSDITSHGRYWRPGPARIRPRPGDREGTALNEHGYHVWQVERNLYAVTDNVYMSAFLTTPDGVVIFDAPPNIGHNIRRAVDEITAANGLTNQVTHMVYSHHHCDHQGASSLFGGDIASATRRPGGCCCATLTPPAPSRT